MSWSLKWSEGRGGSIGPLERWLRWSAHPFSDAVCRDHGQYPAFSPDTSKVTVGFLVFLYLDQNLHQLCMYVVIFSPL